MKNNSLLTYVLYGLLGLIIAVAGYYACQKQKEKNLKKEQDEAELQQTLRNMGYAQDDTTAATGSSFASEKSTAPTTTGTTSKTGIEDEPATTTSKTGVTTTAKPAEKTPTTTTTTTAVKPTVTKPTTSTPSIAPKKTTTTTAKGVAGPGTGRWAVRAGTFAYMDGARRRLEQVIKAGYPNAEISKTSDGKAAVVVLRTNDKTAAIKVVDKLEEKGIDAAVFDRKN